MSVMNDVMILSLPFAPAFDGAVASANEIHVPDPNEFQETNFALSSDVGVAQLDHRLFADLEKSDAFCSLFLREHEDNQRMTALRIDAEGNEIVESAKTPCRKKETDFCDPTTDGEREGLKAIFTEALLIGAGIKLFEHFKAHLEFGDEPTGLLRKLATSRTTEPAVEVYRLMLEMHDWDTAKRALDHAHGRKDRTLLHALVRETDHHEIAPQWLAEYAGGLAR